VIGVSSRIRCAPINAPDDPVARQLSDDRYRAFLESTINE